MNPQQNDSFLSVEVQTEFVRKPIKTLTAGTYNLRLKNVIRKEKNVYGNPYLLFIFEVFDGPEKENVVFHSVAPFLSPGKKLWNALVALGKDPKTIENGIQKEDLVGRKVTASLLVNKNGKNQISLMWPYVEVSSGTSVPPVAQSPIAAPSPRVNTNVAVKTSKESTPVPTVVKQTVPETKANVTEVESSLDDISNLIEF